MKNIKKEESTNNLIILFFILIICLLTCGTFGFWIGTKYYEMNKSKNFITTNQKVDNEIDEDTNRISSDKIENLVNSFSSINPMQYYSDYKQISVNELKDEDVFYVAIKIIILEKLYSVEKFDNSTDTWANDTQINIQKSLIKEIMNKYFGELSYTYFPIQFDYDSYHFENKDDIYIGKEKIIESTLEPDYKYFLKSYQKEENKLIINIVSGYYIPGIGYYKDKSLNELIYNENTLIDEKTEIIKDKYASKLNNLQYIFEIKDNCYQFEVIKLTT